MAFCENFVKKAVAVAKLVIATMPVGAGDTLMGNKVTAALS